MACTFANDPSRRLQDPRIWADPTNPANASTAPLPPRAAARSRITELPDDEDGAAEQEDYDELSDEEEYDEDDSSDGADSMAGNVSPTATQSAHDFFQFGSSLTVKGEFEIFTSLHSGTDLGQMAY